MRGGGGAARGLEQQERTAGGNGRGGPGSSGAPCMRTDECGGSSGCSGRGRAGAVGGDLGARSASYRDRSVSHGHLSDQASQGEPGGLIKTECQTHSCDCIAYPCRRGADACVLCEAWSQSKSHAVYRAVYHSLFPVEITCSVTGSVTGNHWHYALTLYCAALVSF